MTYLRGDTALKDMLLVPELEGFSIPYGPELERILNESIGGRNFNNIALSEIGKAVSANVIHSRHPKTRDGYVWFGKLEFEIKSARVAILFPWGSENKMERSINVYSDKELSPRIVRRLLLSIARQAYLKFQLRGENDFKSFFLGEMEYLNR